MENKKKILIIDDNDAHRTLMTYALREDYEVVEARNGIKGLEVVKEMNPSVILVDQMMPGMDGLETIKAIGEHNPDLKCIMITAMATIPLAVEALKEGALDFIIKPFDPDVLLHIVKKAFDHIKLVEEWTKAEKEKEEALAELERYKQKYGELN